jgi:tRNA(Ile)-lysidine synthase
MLVRHLQHSIRALGLTDSTILVAVSSGVDSVCLLHALGAQAGRFALNLLIGHVNHGLRGEESEADEAWLEGLAEKLDLPILTARVRPGELREGCSNRQRPTIQEAARTLRYRELERMATAAGARFIATAHNADDQAETVLLRLLRGCAPDGLGGIPEVSRDGRVVRPLLRVSRSEIVAHARASGLEWREDTSNQSLRYARNRLRREWIPGLKRDFNPRLLRAIGNLAEAQRRDSEWVESLVEAAARDRVRVEEDGVHILGGDWDQLPAGLATRLARRAFLEIGDRRDLSARHIDRIVGFLRRGREGTVIELPGGLQLSRNPVDFLLQGPST